MLHPSRASAESTVGDKQAQNPFEATVLEADGELRTAAQEMNRCDVPEMPGSPVMDALTHLSSDATQVPRQHLVPSSLKQDAEGNVTQFRWPFLRPGDRP